MCQTQITGMSHRPGEAIWQVDIAVTGGGVTVETSIQVGEAQADAILEAINKWRNAVIPAKKQLAARMKAFPRSQPFRCGRCQQRLVFDAAIDVITCPSCGLTQSREMVFGDFAPQQTIKCGGCGP